MAVTHRDNENGNPPIAEGALAAVAGSRSQPEILVAKPHTDVPIPSGGRLPTLPAAPTTAEPGISEPNSDLAGGPFHQSIGERLSRIPKQATKSDADESISLDGIPENTGASFTPLANISGNTFSTPALTQPTPATRNPVIDISTARPTGEAPRAAGTDIAALLPQQPRPNTTAASLAEVPPFGTAAPGAGESALSVGEESAAVNAFARGLQDWLDANGSVSKVIISGPDESVGSSNHPAVPSSTMSTAKTAGDLVASPLAGAPRSQDGTTPVIQVTPAPESKQPATVLNREDHSSVVQVEARIPVDSFEHRDDHDASSSPQREGTSVSLRSTVVAGPALSPALATSPSFEEILTHQSVPGTASILSESEPIVRPHSVAFEVTDGDGSTLIIRVAVRGDQVSATIRSPGAPMDSGFTRDLGELRLSLEKQGFRNIQLTAGSGVGVVTRGDPTDHSGARDPGGQGSDNHRFDQGQEGRGDKHQGRYRGRFPWERERVRQ